MIASLLLILPAVVIVLAGVALASRAPAQRSPDAPLQRPGVGRGSAGIKGRATGYGSGALDALGPYGGYVVAVLAGIGLMLSIGWPIGWAARNSGALDQRVYDVSLAHQVGWISDATSVLTQVGNNKDVQVVAVVTAVLLGAALLATGRRREALVPLLIMATAYEVEHQVAHALGLLAHRGHPPTTLGTYPSGGCARILFVYGAVLVLIFALWPRVGPRVRVAGWTALAVISYTEGYSRTYRGQHWLTDVLGGWIYGLVGLATMALLVRIATGRRTRRADAPRREGTPVAEEPSTAPR